jgi:peroxiredoxin
MRKYRWILELALAAAAYFSITAYQGRHLLSTGTAAPLLDLPTLDGSRMALADLRGKRTLVHFWATWCGVCRQEFGTLNAVTKGLAPDEALVTVVADSDDAAAVRRFATEHGLHYPVLLANQETLQSFRVDSFPTNYFIAKDGTVAARTIGMSTRVSLNAHLALAR